MAYREGAMKRRFADIRALVGDQLVLMAHALHLPKDDDLLDAPGIVGPGGDRVASLGHHINQETGLKTFVIWMIYGTGEDSQPLPDLPRKARFAPDTLNARLAARFDTPALVLTQSAPKQALAIGQMYNSTFRTPVHSQADAIWFVPKVTPMQR
jgi:erythromycin esterase-like protein